MANLDRTAGHPLDAATNSPQYHAWANGSPKLNPKTWLDEALTAVAGPRESSFTILDAIPAPIYTTDADGRICYYNRACIPFAGRRPEIGVDSWCVTWKIYTTDGDFLPHDQCPMAVAIKEKRKVRGTVAIAERPDGSRVAFTPYPTPLFDQAGNLTGAINMLIDVTEEQSRELASQADRCRRLATGIDDKRTKRVLADMAADYEAARKMIVGQS